MEAHNFTSVTELSGEEISKEQLQRLTHRYVWAATQATGLDVVEVACGSGPGLGLIGRECRSLVAGDISEPILAKAKAHYKDRFDINLFGAENLPFSDKSKDIIILFEAIYYLPHPAVFVDECKRVLRESGRVLIATANKDLSDFNPSPYSNRYFGTKELKELFCLGDFRVDVFGYLSTLDAGIIQSILRFVKRTAIRLGLMPKTMAGKRFLKRLVFGRPTIMPAELDAEGFTFVEPLSVSTDMPDTAHKVLYGIAYR